MRVTLFFLPLLLLGQNVKLDDLLTSEKPAVHGLIGVKVVDLASGEVIYEQNSERWFVPASNTKLFTLALALDRLGPDHTFRTIVTSEEPPSKAGILRGSIRLIGGGDPNLSGRAIPYDPQAPDGDPLRAIEQLADQIAARGVKRISGDVIGDDTLYPYDPIPDGWAADDGNWYYGAPVSALTINDGAVTFSIRPGDPAAVRVTPPVEYFTVDNRVETGLPVDRVRLGRVPGTRQLRLTGRLAPNARGESRTVAVDDPALYAAIALRDALLRRGIQVDGEAVPLHRGMNGAPLAPGAVELAGVTSPPLIEALKIASKESQNLHTEMLLRAVGHARRASGTTTAGLAELREFLTAAGITRQEWSFADGSGLSRLNLVSPAAIIKLLTYMYGSPRRAPWLEILPVGGQDGTLRNRFKTTTASGKLRAKTGTLSAVTALSGYLERNDGRMLAISLMANNQTSSLAARTLIDKIVVILQE